MEKHSNYSPSRLSRIIACPGSVELIDNLMIVSVINEQKSSVDADHGTKLHGVMKSYYRCHPETHNIKALDGIEPDDRILVQEAADYLDLLLKSKGHYACVIASESEVSLKSWGIPDVFGTLDFSIIDYCKWHVDIIDWKFGAGVTVYAKENPQMLAYAAGLIGWPNTIRDITLHVVQPAIDNYDTWSLSANELYDWVHGTLAIALNKCHNSGINRFVPGVSQCRWCEAKNHCETRMTFVQELAVKLFEAKEKLATCPTYEDLVKLIEMAPLVENAINGIRAYLQAELMAGRNVPGLKLVRGRANRVWADEKEAVTWLAKNTSIEELYASKLKSPSQVETESRALKKSEGFKKLYKTPEGKIALVSDKDGRPAIQTSSGAIDVFSKVI